MARFCGKIGFGITAEVAPGRWKDVIVEHKFFGDVLRNDINSDVGEKVTPDFTFTNRISVVAAHNALKRRKQMRYIEFEDDLWRIESIEVQGRRLILSLGGVYNGPTAPAPDAT
jgi:hypothetical protein